MKKKVDAIVIGAGLGGLSAAACLATGGLKTLLLERHNIPGGYATSFVRGRFEFEVALHELSGIGAPDRRGATYRYLENIGVAQRCEFIQAPTLYRSIYPGLDLTLPSGFRGYEQVMCHAFPDDADGILRFLNICRTFGRELANMQKLGLHNVFSPLTAVQLPIRFPSVLRYGHATFWDVLRRHVSDPLARAVLSQFWGYFGLPPARCAFTYFGLGLATYIKHGATYMKGRSQALSQAFVDSLEHNGGEARFHCGVDRILTEGGKVVGVVTDEGEEIRADWIVSNADPLTTCKGLIGRQNVPEAFFRSLQPSTVAPSTVNVYLGLARTPAQLGLTDHEIFISDDLDFERQYQQANTLEAPAAMAVTCYNHVLPEISPEGTSMVVLTALKYGQPWHGVRPEEYLDTKHRIADCMIKSAERIAPDLRKYAEVVEVSTPLTNARYSGNPGGSIYGYNNDPGRHTVWRLPHRGPLRGLYFAGAWTQPGGGFEPVMISGGMAAGAILHKAGTGKEVAL